jgi:DNA repair protein RecO (recombination protein O)
MEWRDEGIILAARPHGESAAIVTLLTREHGSHAGLVRGGAGRRQRGTYQPGNEVSALWRARLADHLGTFTCELTQPRTARLLNDAERLAAVSAACALLQASLPERLPYPRLFEGLCELLDALEREDWQVRYVLWELSLLAELGFGLDLSACAATGRNDDLVYVSPRTGRAVSASAGAPFAAKLLVLPAFLAAHGRDPAEPPGPVEPGDIRDGLTLTGHFLAHHAFAATERGIPPARDRLVVRISR